MQITPNLSDDAITRELGARLRTHRLRRNIPQADLAAEAGISTQTLSALEDGSPPRLVTLIRVLRALDLEAGLDQLVPDPGVSPIEMLDRPQGRQRASRASDPPEEGS